MKLLKCRKALSPVVAAIILIAVTVAVSIAVAAWMGALTIGFMGGTEELNIIGVTYNKADNTTSIEVANVGTGIVTITDIRIDGTTYEDAPWSGDCAELNGDLTHDLEKGNSNTFVITFDPGTWPFESGVKYEFTVLTAKGTQFGPYPKTAPS